MADPIVWLVTPSDPTGREELDLAQETEVLIDSIAEGQ
jgi:hypothetical protein